MLTENQPHVPVIKLELQPQKLMQMNSLLTEIESAEFLELFSATKEPGTSNMAARECVTPPESLLSF